MTLNLFVIVSVNPALSLTGSNAIMVVFPSEVMSTGNKNVVPLSTIEALP